MVKTKIGIGIIAYNRPDYFKWLLHSLENQDNPGQLDYHLFIDGPRTDKDRELIKKSIKLFDISILPNKTKHIRKNNVSIAKNQLDAKDYLANKYDYFIIAEDDVILSPDAIRVMRVLGDYLDSPEIFSATMSFIRHCKRKDIDTHLNSAYLHTKSHWWFELYKSSKWIELRQVFLQYYEIIKDMDYRTRKHAVIREFYLSNGFSERRTSQDSGMDFSLFKSNMKRITPVVNRGLYIGINGTHFNQVLAEKYKFNKQTPYYHETDIELTSFNLIDKSKLF